MALERNIKVRPQVVKQYAMRVLASLTGSGLVEAEMALISAYVQIAPGIKEYPAAEQNDRASLVAQRGASALVDAIHEVARLPLAQVRAELQSMAAAAAKSTN